MHLCILALLLGQFIVIRAYEVVYAVNAGADEFIDVKNNIIYKSDPLTIGTASDFGKQLSIDRTKDDESIYQTERYHTASFGYDISVANDGEYALVLKFCEVYFNAPNMKVFDGLLNGEHTVVDNLDIFQQVGKGVAHDEIVYFTISRGRLYYKEEESEIRGGRIRVDFIKGSRDNPKVNAIILFKDDLENIPKLAQIDETNSSEESNIHIPDITYDQRDDQHESQDASKKPRKTSGPRQMDPYTLDDSTVMLPIFIAIGAFIPLLFCLCKL